MKLDKILKLVKLAVYNPDKEESYRAAILICKLIDDGEFILIPKDESIRTFNQWNNLRGK